MIPQIGTDLSYKGKKVHIQDRNNLSMRALVGVPDENNLIWEPFWVDWADLSEIKEDKKYWESLSEN
jgi:hypothetical protein